MKSVVLSTTVLLFGVVLATGCVATPHDGAIVANHPTTVIPSLNGFGTNPGELVTVYAKNGSGVFEAVATTTTASTGITWSNDEWYYWSISNLDLDSAYWEPKNGGACGAKATLKVKTGSVYTVTLKEPFSECFDYDMDAEEFVEECHSENMPELTVQTCGALCC